MWVMETLLTDLKFGMRTMARNPGLTMAAVFALALGIGANTAAFSVVNAVLLRPLPFRDPDRLAATAGMYWDIWQWKQQSRAFGSIAAVQPSSMSFTTRDEPERVAVAKVNAEFFAMLGVRPSLGRDFLREEDRPGGARVVILTDRFWRRRFGSDPGVIGRTVRLDGQLYTVSGVLPEGFRFDVIRDTLPPEVFAPLALAGTPADGAWVFVYASLKPGVSIPQANAEMRTIFARLDQKLPPGEKRKAPGLVSIRQSIVWDVRRSLTVLLGAVAFVLLIACANVANLLLARASTRRKEIALRASLGAARGRLVRQLMVETLPLGLFGGALGLLLAYSLVPLVAVLPPEQVPFVSETRVDGAVLAFTISVSLLTTLLFGLAPALSASRVDFSDASKEGDKSASAGVRGRRLRNLLVVSEIALAMILTIAASLLIQGFLRLQRVSAGFRPEGLLSAQVSLPGQKYPEAAQRIQFFDRVLGRLRSMPGVLSAGMANEMPLSGIVNGGGYIQDGRPFRGPEDVMPLFSRTVDESYFRTLAIPLRRGRLFNEHDMANSPLVALVSERTARRFWPNQDPIGRRIAGGELGKWTTIVGIVGDVRHEDIGKQPDSEVLFPYSQQIPWPNMTVVVRTDPRIYPDPERFASALRHAVAEIDKDQAVSRVISMTHLMNDRLAMRRLAAVSFGVFAALALSLAAVGIYGVLSFVVAQRRHEIGVRMALGAGRDAVVRLVVGQALTLALTGVVLGLAGGFALTRLMGSMLYGISATDPFVFCGVAIALTGIAALAGYLPARRAARVDPSVALRHE
jgi:putative ABC transport system permease protein